MLSKRAIRKLLLHFPERLSGQRWFNTRTLMVYNYHRIFMGAIRTPFDHGTFSAGIEIFEQQMCFLKEHCQILAEHDLLDIVEKGKELPFNSAMITFDDAYIDNYSLAYPILRKLEIPAIFFVPVQIIEEQKVSWWDVIYYLIHKSKKTSIEIIGEHYFIDNRQKKDTVSRHIMQYIKKNANFDIENFLWDLAARCDVELPDKKLQSNELMSWDQIREVAENNIAIGSHTFQHKVLTTLTPEQQLDDLQKARNFLYEKLHREIRSLAYPVGYYYTYNEETRECARKAGYKIAFSFHTGVNKKIISDPFDIRRISPSSNLPLYKTIALHPRLTTW